MTNMFDNQTLEQNKKNLLAAYCRYLSYVRKLEAFTHRYNKPTLADFRFYKEYGEMAQNIEGMPWRISPATAEDKQNFENLLHNKTKNDPDGCYIGIKYNFDNQQTKGYFRAIPQTMNTSSSIMQFPSLYEYYIAAYKKDMMLKDTVFVVDGRFRMVYNSEFYGDDHLRLADVIDTDVFSERLQSILYATTIIDWYHKDELNLMLIHNEAYASRLLQPIETVILNSMSRTAEITRDIIKGIYRAKHSFSRAEKDGLIPSTERLIDYLNIRHLMHHQCDSLNGYGYFSANLTTSSKDNRDELMASYRRVCDKKLTDRLETYINALDDFRPLVQHFYPNFLSRRDGESVSKFISRIKNYHNENPDSELILELNYDAKNSKNAQVMKNVKKLFPDAKVIDNPEIEIDTVFKEMENYAHLNNYLLTYQEMESYLGFYGLVYGKALQPIKAAELMLEQKAIDQETYEQILKVKETRNNLSHNYFTSEMAQQINYEVIDLGVVFSKVKDVISLLPKGTFIENEVYRFEHSDGKIIDVNFANKTIVRADVVSALKKTSQQTEAPALSTDDKRDDVAKSELPAGTFINYNSKKITFSDKSVFYFNSDEHYCWTIKETSGKNAKFLLDKNFKVQKFILNGHEISFSRGDVLNQLPSYVISLDKQGRLSRYVYKTSNGSRLVTQFNLNNKPNICMPNGTIIDMTGDKPVVKCKAENTAQKTNNGRKL